MKTAKKHPKCGRRGCRERVTSPDAKKFCSRVCYELDLANGNEETKAKLRKLRAFVVHGLRTSSELAIAMKLSVRTVQKLLPDVPGIKRVTMSAPPPRGQYYEWHPKTR